MNVYKVEGLVDGRSETSIARAIRDHVGSDVPVSVDADRGEVRVSASADPQVVVFAIEGCGYPVREVLPVTRGPAG